MPTNSAKDNGSSARPLQLLDWFAGAAFLALVVADRFVERGSSRVLASLGIACLVLAPVFFVPPFLLLKKYGQADDGRPFFETKVAVDRGLYAVVRHPQYLGYILLVFGFMLLSQHLITILLGAIAVLLFYLYTIREEDYCGRQLGSAYRDYCKRVPRFNAVSGMVRYLMRQRRHE
jgi:protein-S-isoprenylcysteine O-methyltransferase Ste14